MLSTKRSLSALALVVLLAACGNPAAAPATIPVPTSAAQVPATAAPTAVAETPTVAATSAPTAAPDAPPPTSAPSTDVLPAPLYTAIRGQIVRFERDGTTMTPITNEPTEGDAIAVTDFAVSSTDNALAYVIQKPGGGTSLIGTDGAGANRAVLFDRQDASPYNPVWSPDGTRIAFSALASNENGPVDGGGLYLIAPGGGEATLLQANTVPATATTDIDPTAFGYSPLAFSPDGTKILASRFSMQIEQCGLAILSVTGGEPLLINAPEATLRTTCGPAAWSADSSTIYTSFVPTEGVYSANAGLWRVDATTGAATTLVPPMADGKQVIISDIATQPNGTINALIGSADTLPQMGDETLVPYQFARIDATNGLWKPFDTTVYTDVQQVKWSPVGNGAVVYTQGDSGRTTLVWFPFDGRPNVTLGADIDMGDTKWGRP